jgi:hypothetical protein
VRKHTSLTFKIGGQKVNLIVECKYYPSTENIVYINVNYGSKKLEQMIEKEPGMMNKIDQYLRKLFQSEYSRVAGS